MHFAGFHIAAGNYICTNVEALCRCRGFNKKFRNHSKYLTHPLQYTHFDPTVMFPIQIFRSQSWVEISNILGFYLHIHITDFETFAPHLHQILASQRQCSPHFALRFPYKSIQPPKMKIVRNDSTMISELRPHHHRTQKKKMCRMMMQSFSIFHFSLRRNVSVQK